jgi:hypothetical protein
MAELHFLIKGNVMKRFITAVAIATTFLISPIANAALTIYNAPATSSPFSFTVPSGQITLTYSGGAAVSQIAAGQQFPNQSYNNVGNTIETTFGLAANTFTPEVGITGSSYKGNVSGSTTTITSDIAYDYLSIHLGGYNVFFHFATLVATNTNFNLTVSKTQGTKGGGLSNYRAYNAGVSEVPIPAAVFFFAPALLGFLGLRRKALSA